MRLSSCPNSDHASGRSVHLEAAAGSKALLLTLALLALAGALIAVVTLTRRPPSSASVPETTAPAAPIEASRTNLVLDDGRLRREKGGEPFTGFMVEHYLGGALRSRSAISNGLLQGLSQGWFTNGQMQVSETFQAGISHGVRTKWYPSGAKQSEAVIVDGKVHGTYKRWHENGALSEQAAFVADRPEGEGLSFYPSGFLKARVVMKDGKPVEQAFYKDGEQKAPAP